MILDAETLELSNSIETMLEAVSGADGQVKPELMESVLEVATTPCRNVSEAGAELRDLRARVAAHGRRARAGDRLGRHASVRHVGGPADRRAPALPGSRRGAALRGPAGADLRGARARRARRPRQGHPRGQRDARARADAARAVGQLALSGAPTPPGCSPPARRSSGPSPASGSRRATTTSRTTRAGSRFMVESRAIEDYTYLWYDVRPHPNFGTVEVRAMDAQTRVEHTLAIAALVQCLVKELSRALRRRQEALPLPLRDARREQVAGRAPRAGGRAGGPAEDQAGCPPASWFGGSRRGCEPHAEDLGCGGGARLSGGPARAAATAPPARWSSTRRTTTCARSCGRSWRPPSPSGRSRRRLALLAQPPRRYPRCSERARALRHLQELQRRGQPLRDRVPLLRAASTQARAEDRSPSAAGAGAQAAGAAAKMPSLPRLRRDEIPGIAPDTRPYVTGAIIVISRWRPR